MNNHDSKFSTGLILGLIIGGGLVFLLGTKSGKNLLKIISERGLDGFADLLEEYDLAEIEEEEDEAQTPVYEESSEEPKETSNGHKKESPKKRFFRRLKK